jgi:hypothetical protein
MTKIYKILDVKYVKESAKTEAQIQKEIIKYLKDNKMIYYKIESVGVPTSTGIMRTNSHKGFSDLMIISENKNYFIELKALNGTLSPHQKKFLLLAKTANNKCAVVCSLNGLLKALSSCCNAEDYVLFEGIYYYP